MFQLGNFAPQNPTTQLYRRQTFIKHIRRVVPAIRVQINKASYKFETFLDVWDRC